MILVSLPIVTIYTSEISEIDLGIFIVQIQSNSDIHDPTSLKKKTRWYHVLLFFASHFKVGKSSKKSTYPRPWIFIIWIEARFWSKWRHEATGRPAVGFLLRSDRRCSLTAVPWWSYRWVQRKWCFRMAGCKLKPVIENPVWKEFSIALRGSLSQIIV